MKGLRAFSLSMVVVLGYLITWVGVLCVALYFQEWRVFQAFGVMMLLFLPVFYALSRVVKDEEITATGGYLVVVISWLGISVVSALPFYACLEVSYINAWLESVSALTTTGIEMIGQPQLWPKSMLWYRQQLEWVGGVGIIIMSIGLLSLQEGTLLSLYNGEFGQDVRRVKVTPRLASSARYVCLIYGGLMLLCTLGHVFFGVPLFYALLESMATVSTGGFSVSDIYPIYDASMNKVIAIVFMLLGAIGFHSHFQFWHTTKIKQYFASESRTMILEICVACLALGFYLSDSIIDVIFDVVAFVSTTGFNPYIHTTSVIAPAILIFLGIVGGCSGSTAGGIKQIRLSVLLAEARVFLLRLIYPKIVSPVAIDDKVLSDVYIANIRGYLGLFLITGLGIYWSLTLLGVEAHQAFYLLCATITNVGGSVADLGVGMLTNTQKFVLSISMLLGRVEIAAFIVILMPKFWQLR